MPLPLLPFIGSALLGGVAAGITYGTAAPVARGVNYGFKAVGDVIDTTWDGIVEGVTDAYNFLDRQLTFGTLTPPVAGVMPGLTNPAPNAGAAPNAAAPQMDIEAIIQRTVDSSLKGQESMIQGMVDESIKAVLGSPMLGNLLDAKITTSIDAAMARYAAANPRTA